MELLGEVLTVKQVAQLIGCSPWTVRQKHIPRGLPCFRSGPSGRLTFYRNQVVAWILEKQNEQKGGTRK
jgi:phage terminase Nu1 subunit (DNA packaging protein)